MAEESVQGIRVSFPKPWVGLDLICRRKCFQTPKSLSDRTEPSTGMYDDDVWEGGLCRPHHSLSAHRDSGHWASPRLPWAWASLQVGLVVALGSVICVSGPFSGGLFWSSC